MIFDKETIDKQKTKPTIFNLYCSYFSFVNKKGQSWLVRSSKNIISFRCLEENFTKCIITRGRNVDIRQENNIIHYLAYEVTMKTNHCWNKRADRSIFWFRSCRLEREKFSSFAMLLRWVHIKTLQNCLALPWLFCALRWFMKLTWEKVYFCATSCLWVRLFKVIYRFSQA